MPSTDDLIRLVPSEATTARIAIDCGHRADRPIDRRLFGKFTEHLGRNIYGGMWAQILRNTSFSDWHYFRNLWSQKHGTGGFPMDRILAACESGLACWWVPYGDPGARYHIDWANPYNSETSQCITAPPGSPETGIAQPIYLPAHRTRDFVAQFHARGNADDLHVALVSEETGETIVERTVDGVTDDWQAFTADLILPDDTVAQGQQVEFRIGVARGGRIWIDQAFLLPRDHVDGFDPDIVRLLRDSRLPLLRYPGGNFVSAYHWQDGIGPIHKRPVKPNPAWNSIEPNHVGTDEFIAFCAAVGCEPMICVNAGTGRPDEAAQWVEYCNGAADTEFGRLRAENGHPEPYAVKHWEIGNELYGRWQFGHCTPEEYAERYEAFRNAMLDVDPGIHVIANGQSLEWNAPLVERKGEAVTSLSLHTLIGREASTHPDPEAVFKALMAYTAGYDDQLRALKSQAREAGCKAHIAITEIQVFTNVPNLPNNATQTESLFLAGIIHSALRQGDLVEMITHSALVNHGGGLRKDREVVYANPVHWVSHLYGNLPPVSLVASTTETPTFAADVDGVASGDGYPLVDAFAAISDDDRNIVLLIINRHPTDTVTCHVGIEGFAPSQGGELQSVAGESYMSKNTLDQPNAVVLERDTVAVDGQAFEFSLPPHSVNALTLDGDITP